MFIARRARITALYLLVGGGTWGSTRHVLLNNVKVAATSPAQEQPLSSRERRLIRLAIYLTSSTRGIKSCIPNEANFAHSQRNPLAQSGTDTFISRYEAEPRSTTKTHFLPAQEARLRRKANLGRLFLLAAEGRRNNPVLSK